MICMLKVRRINNMSLYAVYFSATGNTEKSVKAMAGAIAE